MQVTPTTATVELMVGFHPENVCCDGCWALTDDSRCRGRKICFFTTEIIHYPKQRGIRCPLKFEEDNSDGQS